MLRPALSALLVVGAVTCANAQETDAPRPGEAAEASSPIDFIIRPTQGIEEEEGIRPDGAARQPLALDAAVGPPLAGPTGQEPIGPAMAGPQRRAAAEEAERRRREPEADPFAQQGLRLGSFIIRPAIEIGVELTDNARGGSDGDSAAGLVVAPELALQSDGDRLDVDARVRGEAVFYGDRELDEREADARLSLRYALTPRTALEAELGYALSLEDYSDPDTPQAALERPPVHSFDASLGATQRFGRLEIGVRGTLEREVHEDVDLSGGGSAARDELDNTEYGIALRASMEASAAIRPFVEMAGGQREFDQEVDDDGFRRSGPWGELRGGLVFDFGEKLNGEVSIGYRRETFEDDRLEELDAVTAAAAILWSPRRLTELRFDLSTETRPTSVGDASGSVLYSSTLTLSRRLNPRLRLEAGAGLDYERATGDDWHDVTYRGFAGASYAFNRRASLVARYSYERIESSLAGGDYDVNTVGVRLRLQR